MVVKRVRVHCDRSGKVQQTVCRRRTERAKAVCAALLLFVRVASERVLTRLSARVHYHRLLLTRPNQRSRTTDMAERMNTCMLSKGYL